MQTKLRKGIYLILVCLLLSSMAESKQVFIASSDIPPGFLILNEPQRSQIDIYYGGRYLCSQITRFTSETLKISSPEEVVRLIPHLAEPQQVIRALSGEIAGNPDKVCVTGDMTDCGRLSPEIAGVIFNEDRFRLDLFINRRYLNVQQADIQKYLPPSDGRFTFLQNLSLTASGTTGAESDNLDGSVAERARSDFIVGGISLLSWKESSLYSSWDFSREKQLNVNDLYGQREFEGMSWQGGMLSTRGFGLNFTHDRTLLGGRISTSDFTRTDTDFTRGSPLDVFLPTRGRVELRKDDKLLATEFMEAGNQQVNTTALPDGAYNLQIRIVDDLGQEISNETRFFAKQNRLPAMGIWEWFAEGGRVLDRTTANPLPGMTKQFLGRMGVGRRLGSAWSGTLVFAADNNDALLEAGLFNVGRFWEISPHLMVGARGDYGVSLNIQGRMYWLNFFGYYRRLWNQDYKTGNANFDERKEPQPIQDDPDYHEDNSLIGAAFEQFSSSVHVPFITGNLSYRYSFYKQPSHSTHTQSFNWRRQFWRGNNYDVDVEFSISRSGDRDIMLATAHLNFRDNRWNFRLAPTFEQNKTTNSTDHDERLRMTTHWNDGDWLDGDLRLDGGLQIGSRENRIDGRINYGDHHGSMDLAFVHTRGHQVQATGYSLNLNTSLMTNGEYFTVGGENISRSGVVISIAGKEGDHFDVLVDDQRIGYAVVGQPTLIPLNPYHQYRISLRPSGMAIYHFDEKQELITLYPGNVVRIDVNALPIQLAFGRVLFQGKVVQATILGGLKPVATDQSGLFQLELSTNTTSLDIQLDEGWRCPLKLPFKSEDDVIRLGTLRFSEDDCQFVKPSDSH